MAEFLGSPKVQYFKTSTQEFLSGGLLYTYSPGTLTDKATYPTIADAVAGTNANTNPVVLDTRGEATVVLNGSTKLILKDADGNQVWSVDAVGGANVDIFDTDGNELLTFFQVSSAVNYIQISNAAAGNRPIVEAKGGDTNIGLELKVKGSGQLLLDNLTWPATDGTAGTLLRTNGSGTLAFTALVWPNVDGTAGKVLQTNGSGTIQFSPYTMPTADGTALTFLQTNGSGVVSFQPFPAAAQSDQETATSTTTLVTPGRQQYHPSAAKGWVKCGVAGDIVSSNNVTSVTDTATGQITINWTTAFSSTGYSIVGMAHSNTTNHVFLHSVTLATGTALVYCVSDAGTVVDPTVGYSVVAYGDQ